jgi:hypothetical protein
MSDLIEVIITGLVEDEAWQSHLEDGERTQLIEAVQRRLEAALKAERARLVGNLRTINQSMAHLEGPQRADVLNSLSIGFGL